MEFVSMVATKIFSVGEQAKRDRFVGQQLLRR